MIPQESKWYWLVLEGRKTPNIGQYVCNLNGQNIYKVANSTEYINPVFVSEDYEAAWDFIVDQVLGQTKAQAAGHS